MTTNSDILRRAMRLFGGLVNNDTPEGQEATDAMARLQALVMELPGLLKNGPWRTTYADSAATACEGHRVFPDDDTVAITLPTSVTPLGGCRRPPLDLARVHIMPPAANAGLWVYVASRGEWVQVDNLTLNGDFPFGVEDEEGFAAMLAQKLSSEDELPLPPSDQGKATLAYQSFRSRFKKPNPDRDCGFRDYL